MRSIVGYQKTETATPPNGVTAPDLGTPPAPPPDVAASDVIPSPGPTDGARVNRSAGFDSIGRSALTHPVLVVALTILGLLAGTAVGYVHPPTYTATAHLIVGRTSGLAEDEVPGLAAAVQGLASDYARLITASNVVADTEATLHRSSLGGTLTASPIPESSNINVQGSASSEAGALQLANAGAAALVKVVTEVTNDTEAQLKPIIANYQTEDSLYEKAVAQVNLLQNQLNTILAAVGTGPPTPAQDAEEQSLNTQIAQWQTQADTARLEADAYQNDYNAALPPLQVQQEIVSEVGTATSSGSDRKSYVEAGGLAGAVGGLVLGLAGAALIDTRRGRRNPLGPAQ